MPFKQGDEITRSILNSAPDAVVCFGSNWKISFWNFQATKIFGWKEEDVIGKRISETIIPVNRRKKYDEVLNQYLQTKDGVDPKPPIEIEAIDRAGKEFWVAITVAPVYRGGKDFFCGYIRDITEIKNAGEEIRKEKELSDFVFENLPGIFYVQDEAGKYLRWNKNFEIASGYSAEEVEHLRSLDFFHDDDRVRVDDAIKKVFREGKAEVVADAVTKDKRVVPFYFRAKSIIYEGKKCLIGTGVDLSKQQRAQAEVKKIEEKYRALFEQASDPIMVTDFKGNFLDVNESFCKLFGYLKSELMGMNISRLIDAEQLKAAPINFARIAAGDHVFSRRSMVHKDGHIVEVEANTKKISETSILAIARDITERIKVENELAESENRLRTIFETEPECIKLIGADGSLIDMNPAGLAIIEAESADQVIGRNILQLVDDEFKPAFLKLNNEVFSGKSRTLEFSITGLKGTHRWMEMHAVPLRSKSGDVISVLSVSRDITERRKAEERIKQSEERYRALVENATEALVVFDAETQKFESVSQSAVDFFKMSKEELLKIGPLDLSPEYQPNGSLSSLYAEEKIAETIAGGKPSFEWMHTDKDGNHIACEVNLVRLPSDHHVLIRGSIFNISDRKKAEEVTRMSAQKYKLLFNKNPFPMFMLSKPDLKLIDVNEAAAIQYGYSREEFLNLTAFDIRPDDDVTPFMNKIENSPELINDFGIRKHRKKDGTIIKVEVKTHQIVDDGRPALLVLTNDVTERMIAEEEIKRSHEELRQLSSYLETIREEERTSIAREIHDELGQQLTGLKMDISWLSKKINGESKVVHEKISGMLSLVDETVKTVRRISTELRPGILDDLGLVDALQWQSHEFEKRTGITSKFDTSFSESSFEKKLSTGIFRVFQETLTNIARHAQASKINTSFERQEENLVLRIKDNGKGFNESEIKVKRTLGLVGMKERAKMFGGNLDIKSQAGKGTEITLSVPMRLTDSTVTELMK